MSTSRSDDEGRNEYRGLSMCQIIRCAGARNLNKQQAKAVCEKVGLHPANGTLHIQLGQGRNRYKLPELTADLEKELFGDVMPPPAEKKASKPRAKLSDEDRKSRKEAKKAKAHKLVGHAAPATK